MARVWSQIRRVAPHFRAALIVAEPGAGAHAAARVMHSLSPISGLPFRTLDAAAAESALSNPLTDLQGLLFLPDVDRLSPAAQRGLIRKLRLRGRALFRVVAASSTEPRASVSAGRFSAELADVLGTVRIVLPPLRERVEDLPLLTTLLLRIAADRLSLRAPMLATDFHDACAACAWPGNFTQLQQTMERLLSLNETGTLTAANLTTVFAGSPEPQSKLPEPVRMVPLEDIVQEHIRAVLIGCEGNKLRAAEVLGISRSTLYRMLDGAVANRHFPIAM